MRLQIFSEAIGATACRIEIESPGATPNTWRKRGAIDTASEQRLDEKWKSDISLGAKHILQESWVSSSDPHYDAKLWPHMHPYGTGSLWSEVGSGGLARLAKNRLLLVQSSFRDNNIYAFWFLHRIICKELFFKQRMKKKQGRGSKAETEDGKKPDGIARHFGTAMPNDIPESTEWSATYIAHLNSCASCVVAFSRDSASAVQPRWRVQQRELFALSDDSENGLMQSMVLSIIMSARAVAHA